MPAGIYRVFIENYFQYISIERKKIHKRECDASGSSHERSDEWRIYIHIKRKKKIKTEKKIGKGEETTQYEQ